MAMAIRDEDLFEATSPFTVFQRMGLQSRRMHSLGRHVFWIVLVGWVPLIILSALQSLGWHTDSFRSLMNEIGVHARYLIAAPLLVVAHARCAPQLNAILHQFVDAGIVRDTSRSRFHAALTDTRRLLASATAKIAIIALAYLIAASAIYSHDYSELPHWFRYGGETQTYSLAGWWHLLVSLPLLLVLIFSLLWRLVLWTRLLRSISRLDLQLVASHPDHAAGLGFVGHSTRAFSTAALALMTIVAARAAHLVLTGGHLTTSNLLFNLGMVATVLAIFIFPLTMFSPVLLKTWQSASLRYDGLAERVGAAFETKWLDLDKNDRQSALETPDFSATADLYSVVTNAHAVRLVPVSIKNLTVLTGMTVIPFVPVLFIAIPPATLFQHLKGLLL
jgi:hypothetical protein